MIKRILWNMAIAAGILLGAVAVAFAIPLTYGVPTQVTVTCGASSTTLLAAGLAKNMVRVAVPAGGVTVWFNWAGAAATAAPPSDPIPAGTAVWWVDFVPSTAITCIAASGTQAVTLVYQ